MLGLKITEFVANLLEDVEGILHNYEVPLRDADASLRKSNSEKADEFPSD